MITHNELQRLASFIKKRNAADNDISALIGCPAEKSHIAEFIAAGIFRIELYESANRQGSDGEFTDGDLRGRSVNIKFSGKNDGTLNMATLDRPDQPDFYLVLTGLRACVRSAGI